MGQYDRAVVEGKIAQELNPRWSFTYENLMRLYNLLGKFDKTMEQYQKGKKIDPNLTLGNSFYFKQGKYKEYIEILKKQEDQQFSIGCAYLLSGEREKGEEILNNELIELKKEEYVFSYYIAGIYGALGDNDNHFKWLEQAYDERDSWLPFIKPSTEGDDNIRSAPRQKAFLGKRKPVFKGR